MQAVLAYFAGASYRSVARIFGGEFGKDAVRYWWNRVSFLFDYIGGPHAVVVADETNVQLGLKSRGNPHKLWVAIDAENLKVVAARFSRHAYMLDCRDFLHEVEHRSRPQRPILIHDKGPWYAIQAKHVGLQHHEVRGGVRSLIEMWNRHLKHRLDGFWRTFPHNTHPEQAARWLRSYAAIWNVQRGW